MNCLYFHCTVKNTWPQKWRTLLDGVMSQSELVTILDEQILLCKTAIMSFFGKRAQKNEMKLCLYINSDKLGNQQVVTNCLYFHCTVKNTCPPKWRTLLDGVMSQSELLTILDEQILLCINVIFLESALKFTSNFS